MVVLIYAEKRIHSCFLVAKSKSSRERERERERERGGGAFT